MAGETTTKVPQVVYPIRLERDLYNDLKAEATVDHAKLADHIRRILYRRNRGDREGSDNA